MSVMKSLFRKMKGISGKTDPTVLAKLDLPENEAPFVDASLIKAQEELWGFSIMQSRI